MTLVDVLSIGYPFWSHEMIYIIKRLCTRILIDVQGKGEKVFPVITDLNDNCYNREV